MAIWGDVEFYRGEDVVLDLNVPASTITGWTLALTVRSALGIDPPLLTVAGTVAGPNNATFAVASAATAGWAPGYYPYDLARTDPGAQTILRIGRLHLKAEVNL